MKHTDKITEDVTLALVHATNCDQCRAKMSGAMAYAGFMCMEVAAHAREVDESEKEPA